MELGERVLSVLKQLRQPVKSLFYKVCFLDAIWLCVCLCCKLLLSSRLAFGFAATSAFLPDFWWLLDMFYPDKKNAVNWPINWNPQNFLFKLAAAHRLNVLCHQNANCRNALRASVRTSNGRTASEQQQRRCLDQGVPGLGMRMVTRPKWCLKVSSVCAVDWSKWECNLK